MNLNHKGSLRVRDVACRLLSLDVGNNKLTVDQEVGGSNPPSCTSRINKLCQIWSRSITGQVAWTTSWTTNAKFHTHYLGRVRRPSLLRNLE
jgi:hypothetical protein